MSNKELPYQAYSANGERAVDPAHAPRDSVIIPTLNEARNLPHVFSRIPAGIGSVDPSASILAITSPVAAAKPQSRLTLSLHDRQPNAWSAVTGDLQDGSVVRYRTVLSRAQAVMLGVLITVSGGAGLALLAWLIIASRMTSVLAMVLVVMMVVLESARIWQTGTLAIFASRMRDPVPLKPAENLRVAVLTTIVPGKEPVSMVTETLRAMKRIRYDGPVDVWLLDEGNSPEVRAACESLGVRHFSRHGIDRWQRPSGEFKARTKHGNHNAWRDAHGAEYDVVAQMDADHIPFPDFLERTIGYFNDPDTAYVVMPMVYGNWDRADYGAYTRKGNWIAHGAAQQAFVFQGVVQRGANGLGAPLLIGTNHVYRVACWDQIGGYQDSIIEDHLTAMAVYASRNLATGNRWKGIYSPDIAAIGEGPTSFTDFFNQQKRWSFGCWQVILRHSGLLLPKMRKSQRLSFRLLQPFYPSVALSWVLSIALNSVYLISHASLHLPPDIWGTLWGSSVVSSFLLFLWLRRFNLTPRERSEWGMPGMALMLMTTPVFVAAAVSKLLGRKLAYAVTAKGDLAAPDNINTFRPHLIWIAWSAVQLYASFTGVFSSWVGLRIWSLVAAGICLSPLAVTYLPRMHAAIRQALSFSPFRQLGEEEA